MHHDNDGHNSNHAKRKHQTTDYYLSATNNDYNRSVFVYLWTNHNNSQRIKWFTSLRRPQGGSLVEHAHGSWLCYAARQFTASVARRCFKHLTYTKHTTPNMDSLWINMVYYGIIMSKTSGNQTWQLDIHWKKSRFCCSIHQEKWWNFPLPRLITRGQQWGIGASHWLVLTIHFGLPHLSYPAK